MLHFKPVKDYLTVILTFAFVVFTFSRCETSGENCAKMIRQLSSDKKISVEEMTMLEESLENAIAKKSEVKIGTREINSYEDLIGYLESRHCDIEGRIEDGRDSVSFKNLFIIMENSVSMKGYVGRGNPHFAEPILALFECEAGKIETCYAGANGDKVDFKLIDSNVFLSNITGGQFSTGISSPLDKMISSAVDMILGDKENECSNVFCFITDGIMSGTNSEIVANRDFTVNNLPLLEKRIRDAVSKAKNCGLDCLVYRLETQFDGVYFDYQNGRHNIKGPRPYYMVIVGDKVNLHSVENSLSKEENFTSKAPRRFASYDVTSLKTLTNGKLKNIAGQNAIAKGHAIEYDPSKVNMSPVVFGIQFNLSSLPSYYLNINALSSRLRLSYIDKTSGTEVTIPNGDWLDNIDMDVDTGIFLFTVSMEQEYLNKMSLSGDMRLCMEGYQDDWYKLLSSNDDKNIANGDTTTFALEKFMGGIMKGFGYEGQRLLPNAIDFEFNVKRSK